MERSVKKYCDTVRVGQRVMSRYQARWTGVVEDVTDKGYAYPVALVRVTHDRNGNPVRKTFVKTLSVLWLQPVEQPA